MSFKYAGDRHSQAGKNSDKTHQGAYWMTNNNKNKQKKKRESIIYRSQEWRRYGKYCLYSQLRWNYVCMIYAYKIVNVIYPDNIKYNSKNLRDGSKQSVLILSLIEE